MERSPYWNMWKHLKCFKMCNLKQKIKSNQKKKKIRLSGTFILFGKSSDTKLNNKYNFSIFTFWKWSFFKHFEKKFQNGPKNQLDAKSGKNYISTLYSFIFHHKNVFFWCWPFFSLFWHGITRLQTTTSPKISLHNHSTWWSIRTVTCNMSLTY